MVHIECNKSLSLKGGIDEGWEQQNRSDFRSENRSVFAGWLFLLLFEIGVKSLAGKVGQADLTPFHCGLVFEAFDINNLGFKERKAIASGFTPLRNRCWSRRGRWGRSMRPFGFPFGIPFAFPFGKPFGFSR